MTGNPVAQTRSATACRRLMLLLLVILLGACEPEPAGDKPTTPQPTVSAISNEAAAVLAANLWQQGLETLDALLAATDLLEQSTTAFLQQTSAESLAATRTQWRATLLEYHRLLPFLYLDKIGTNDFDNLVKSRSNVGAWPLQPGYLDSFDIHIHSGIVNDISLPINAAQLRKQHGLTDPEEVTLGLYAMEFLLWTDEVPAVVKRFKEETEVPLAFAKAGLKLNELPNNRRRQLLALQAQLLKKDVKSLQKQWRINGDLAIRYNKLAPFEKLMAMHSGLQACLGQIRLLLLNHGEGRQIDTLSFNRFAGNREQAIHQTLTRIESIYFSRDNNLLQAVFREEATGQLAALFTNAKTPLIDIKADSHGQTAATIKDILRLFTADTP